MIRVIICDDQAVIRDGLEMILSADTEIEVVGLAQDGEEAVELVNAEQPDLVLMDLKMPIMNGIQATREIKKFHPDIKILVLTTFAEDEWIFDAIHNGANGYLLKGTPRQDLIKAIKGTLSGEAHIDPSVGAKLLNRVAQSQPQENSTLQELLSPRELEILKLIGKGFTNTEIAAQLYLTHGTVRNYVSTILNKLGVEDRTQAAVLAIKYGLV